MCSALQLETVPCSRRARFLRSLVRVVVAIGLSLSCVICSDAASFAATTSTAGTSSSTSSPSPSLTASPSDSSTATVVRLDDGQWQLVLVAFGLLIFLSAASMVQGWARR